MVHNMHIDALDIPDIIKKFILKFIYYVVKVLGSITFISCKPFYSKNR